MLYDTGDVVRIRSGSGTAYQETLIFIVDDVDLNTCTVHVKCINPARETRVPHVLRFRDIELLKM